MVRGGFRSAAAAWRAWKQAHDDALDEFVTALRARLRNEYPALLPRFQRERGVAQHCSHQYSGWGTAGIVSFARTVQRTSGELASS